MTWFLIRNFMVFFLYNFILKSYISGCISCLIETRRTICEDGTSSDHLILYLVLVFKIRTLNFTLFGPVAHTTEWGRCLYQRNQWLKEQCKFFVFLAINTARMQILVIQWHISQFQQFLINKKNFNR